MKRLSKFSLFQRIMNFLKKKKNSQNSPTPGDRKLVVSQCTTATASSQHVALSDSSLLQEHVSKDEKE